jgi:hypothetical protein
MTEAEWLACTDPTLMLEQLRGKASERKLRLFACACGLTSQMAEDDPERYSAFLRTQDYADDPRTPLPEIWLGPGAAWPYLPLDWARACCRDDGDRDDLPLPSRAELLRDIFGLLPFHPVAIDPAWLRWNHGTVPAVARRIYEERAFHDLPILADALEDAGCADPDLLAHCRSGGEHVRGCWALDLLLGRA